MIHWNRDGNQCSRRRRVVIAALILFVILIVFFVHVRRVRREKFIISGVSSQDITDEEMIEYAKERVRNKVGQDDIEFIPEDIYKYEVIREDGKVRVGIPVNWGECEDGTTLVMRFGVTLNEEPIWTGGGGYVQLYETESTPMKDPDS